MVWDKLTKTQKSEVMRQIGATKGISPEGIQYAMQAYLKALQHQADVARCFYFGKLEQGLEKMLELPEDVRMQIDQLVWEATGGEMLDPTEPEAQKLISAAILHSMELRMGLQDEE